MKAFHTRKRGMPSGGQGDRNVPPSKVGRGTGGVRFSRPPRGMSSRGPQGGRGQLRGASQEGQTSTLAYFMDIVKSTIILRIIIGERHRSFYSMIMLSTRLQHVPSPVKPSRQIGQILNNQI